MTTATPEMVSAGYLELVDLAKFHKQSFGRQIHVELYRPPEGILCLTRMHDDVHDLALALLVDAQTLALKNIGARMDRIPFGTCPQALISLQRAVGVELFQKGIMKILRARIGRIEGCTHIFEMLEASLRGLFVELRVGVLDGEKVDVLLSQEERRQLGIVNPVLSDSCLSFRSSDRNDSVIVSIKSKLRRPVTTPPGESSRE